MLVNDQEKETKQRRERLVIVCDCVPYFLYFLSQWGGLLFHLFLGADGHCDHAVCRWRQHGEDAV